MHIVGTEYSWLYLGFGSIQDGIPTARLAYKSPVTMEISSDS